MLTLRWRLPRSYSGSSETGAATKMPLMGGRTDHPPTSPARRPPPAGTGLSRSASPSSPLRRRNRALTSSSSATTCTHAGPVAQLPAHRHGDHLRWEAEAREARPRRWHASRVTAHQPTLLVLVIGQCSRPRLVSRNDDSFTHQRSVVTAQGIAAVKLAPLRDTSDPWSLEL